MQTLTPAKARQNLTSLLTRALKGEDIGILWDGEVVALRPTKVHSEDYAMLEYGVTQTELKRMVKNIKRLSKNEKAQRWDGTKAGLFAKN